MIPRDLGCCYTRGLSHPARCMELFGIAFSIPVAFVASMLYCLLLARVIAKYEEPSRWLRVTSCLVLASFAGELALLVSLGSVRSRSLLGLRFYVAHVILFFLGPPALAISLFFEHRMDFSPSGMWQVHSAPCSLSSWSCCSTPYQNRFTESNRRTAPIVKSSSTILPFSQDFPRQADSWQTCPGVRAGSGRRGGEIIGGKRYFQTLPQVSRSDNSDPLFGKSHEVAARGFYLHR
jgi:hypothetical protein